MDRAPRLASAVPIGGFFAFGSFSFAGDPWRQHNEARKGVPTAISVGLAALLGGYDTTPRRPW